jgi:hypothetical protein
MSKALLRSKKVLGLIALAAILAVPALPSTALASEHMIGECEILPFDSPGVTIADQRILPGTREITVCAYNYVGFEVFAPRFQMHTGCGPVCFTLKVRVLPTRVDSLGGAIYANYVTEDGTRVWLAFHTIPPFNVVPSGDEICLIGVGTPDPCDF